MHPAHEQHDAARSFGQRTADAVTAGIGSWAFILVQSALLAVWIGVNTVWWCHPHWDPAPYIGLNLVLSFQAAYTGPVVMMSSNRAADRDRALAQHDYAVNCRALARLEEVVARLERDADQWRCGGGCRLR